MSITAAKLQVVVTGETQGAEGALARLNQNMSRFGGVATTAFGVFLGNALTTGVRALSGLLASTVGGASDLAETTNKIGVVFGDAAGAINDFAANAAGALGQTRQQALDAAATFGVFGKSANLSGGDLADFSTGLAGLSSDLASFYNTSPEEAITAIGAALRGESEPIRKYGVLLDEATLRQKALELGIVKTTKDALTPQQRVLAAQAVIMDQTADAQGDFARTSGGLANQQRILQARFTDLKTTIGAGLLPVVTQIVTAFNTFLSSEQVKTFVDQAIAGFGQLATAIGPFIQGLISQIPAAFDWLLQNGEMIKGMLAGIGAAFAIGGTIAGVASAIAMLTNPITLLIAAGAALGAAWATDWGGIRTTLTNFWTTTGQPIFAQLVAWLQTNVPAAIQTLTNFWTNTLQPAIKAVWEFLSRDMMPIWSALAQLFTATVSVAITALAGIWTNVLQPAMRTAWEFIQTKLLPIFNQMVSGLGRVEDIIRRVADWIRTLAERISNIQLPDWMTPGSPTPWEIGLRGVAKELKGLNQIELPTLERRLTTLPASVMMGAGAGGVVGSGYTEGDTFLTVIQRRGENSSAFYKRFLNDMQRSKRTQRAGAGYSG